MADELRRRMVRAIQQSKNHARAVEDGILEAIGLAAKEADRVLEGTAVPVDDLIRSAIDGAVEAGADLASVSQGVLAGILGDGRKCGLAAQEAFEDAARTILQHTERIGGDLAAASRGILQGAIRNAKRLGLRSGSQMSKAAEGMSLAAQDLGTAAIEEVRQTKRKRTAS